MPTGDLNAEVHSIPSSEWFWQHLHTSSNELDRYADDLIILTLFQKYTLVQAEFRNKVDEQRALQSILLKLEINVNFSLIWRCIYWDNIKNWIVVNFVFGNVVNFGGKVNRSIERGARVCRVK